MVKNETSASGAEIFNAETGAAIDAAWEQLLAQRGIAGEEVAVSIGARRDILRALGWPGEGDVPRPKCAVAAGFFYRDNDGDGRYTPGEAITATLLGLPELQGTDAPPIEAHANCFWFGPLEPGEKYTLSYDVHGVERFSHEFTPELGLNIVHVPVAPTKPLTYIVSHSHFDPEWRDTYEGYLRTELPQLIERIQLLRERREQCFNLDEECVIRPLIERHPEVREEVRQRVIEGAIEVKGIITGGELTMPLGESMIRQMTDGEQLISSLLGMTIRPNTFWSIDNYGFNFQLPQILAKAGRKYMVLGEYSHHLGAKIVPTELPFSDTETWKHPEFWLEGLDGSKVLVHRSNYGTEPRGPQMFTEKLRSHQSVVNFEGGDFSPAPKNLPERLTELNDPEAAAKYEGVTDSLGRPLMTRPPGECKFIIATSEQFFPAIERAPDLPTIRTESRIGFWTGCYESRVRGRQLSRETQCLLVATEALSTGAALEGMDDAADRLREAWYLLLINHHHDPQLTVMAPGLFDEVIERYVESLAAARSVLDDTLAYVADRAATDAQPGQPVVVFNPLAWSRSGVVAAALPRPTSALRVVDGAGPPAPAQVPPDEKGKATGVAFAVEAAPPMGWRTYYVQPAETTESESGLTASEELLENEHVRVELSQGVVQKIVEKSSGRCLFAADESAGVNEVFIWEDEGCIAQIRPVDFMDSAKLLCRSSQARRKTRLAEAGPARAVVETTFEMDWGKFNQRVVLEAGARWIDFETHVDWRPADEGGRRIRVAFPSTFSNADVWRDIPFAVQPWEQSDTIQPMNTWLGLSDDDAGAALLHDGPCSQQVRGDCLWQTLFRSIRMPGRIEDEQSDPPCNWDLSGDTALEEGENTYRYRLYPYQGDWRAAAVPRASVEFNTPMVSRPADTHAGELPGEQSYLAVEPADLVHCAWKRADYSDATIVRIYNPTGRSVRGTLRTGFPVRSADETDFREEHVADLAPGSNGLIALDFAPYEIKPIRLVASSATGTPER